MNRDIGRDGIRRLQPMDGVWLLFSALLLVGCGVGPQINPLAERVVDLRENEVDRIHEALSEAADALGGEVLAESRKDECYAGQQSWKVDTQYRHRCSLVMGVVVGIDGDFRSQMLSFDESLERLGWTSDDGEWPGLKVDDYWTVHAPDSDGQVRISLLPGVWGIRQDDLRMLFDYSNPDDEGGRSSLERSQSVTLWCCGLPYHDEGEYFDVGEVADNAHHEHLVLITIEGHYFEK